MNEMCTLDKQKSQSGQAVVEYVLLLVISIALILGLANQLSKPFSAWMKDYMGQYIECLLDMGELPTIGGGSDSGECNSKFKKFSIAEGRPRDPTKSSNSSSSDNLSNSRRGSSSETSNAVGGSSGNSSSSGRSKGFPIGKNGGADGPGSELGDKQMTEALPASQYFRLRSSSSSSVAGGSSSQANPNGLVVPLNKKQPPDKGEKSVKVAAEVGSGTNAQAKKLIITPPERKPSAVEDDQPWGIGQYLKFALILVIIIAIVLFLGGQILQISKSMEK